MADEEVIEILMILERSEKTQIERKNKKENCLFKDKWATSC